MPSAAAGRDNSLVPAPERRASWHPPIHADPRREEPMREVWTCAECGRRFANRNQSHACGWHELEAHSETLGNKREIIVGSKLDVTEGRERRRVRDREGAAQREVDGDVDADAIK